MKKTLLLYALILAFALLTSCATDRTNNPTESTDDVTSKPLNLGEIYDAIAENTDMQLLNKYSAEDIKSTLGIAPEDYTQIVAAISDNDWFPDFLFMCVPSSKESADKIIKKLENAKNYKENSWRDYVPEQYVFVERSAIVSESGVIYYVISSADESVAEVIKSHLK